MKIFLLLYLIVGISACLVLAWRDRKSSRGGELPLSIIFEPVWPVIFLWPLWIAITLIDRGISHEKPDAAPTTPSDPIGQTAVVVSALRPVGRVKLGPDYFDARSDGRIIPEGRSVRIVSRSMSELVVEEIG